MKDILVAAFGLEVVDVAREAGCHASILHLPTGAPAIPAALLVRWNGRRDDRAAEYASCRGRFCGAGRVCSCAMAAAAPTAVPNVFVFRTVFPQTNKVKNTFPWGRPQ